MFATHGYIPFAQHILANPLTQILRVAALICVACLLPPMQARNGATATIPASAPAATAPARQAQASPADIHAIASPIPVGTILPVRLNTSLSSSKSKPGEPLSATIMQDVPLPSGAKLRRGTRVLGHVVAVSPSIGSAPATISLQFDKLSLGKHSGAPQTAPITTDLRAIAGFMAILEAQTPAEGPGESDVFAWLTTVQIGGDVVYGEGGPVTKGDDPSHAVGKSVPYGVLSEINARPGTACRGPIAGNNAPQALWVFSSDACGVYGIANVSVSHAGRSQPVGLVVLSSTHDAVKIPSGAGLLLRVNPET